MLGGGAAALAATALARRGLTALPGESEGLPDWRPARVAGPSSHLIPNVRLRTAAGEDRWFYDDLVHDRIVVIHFFSIPGDAVYPTVDRLVEVQRLLAERVGRDLFFLSITTSPEHDTPERLTAFARERGIGPGWTLLTGRRREVDFLRSFLFLRRPFVSGRPMQGARGPCCSVGMARYGNERLGRWGSFPLKIRATSIAERFRWIGFRSEDAPRREDREEGAR